MGDMNDDDMTTSDRMHIDYAVLSSFADGDLGRRRSAAVRSHLEACAVCRDEVQFIWMLGAAIRTLPSPRAPAPLIDEILPDAPPDSADDRVVPLFDSQRPEPRPARRPRRAVAAGIAVLGAAALLSTVFANRAAAGASTMAFERTRAGALDLRYETISPLAAETSVRARIRYWVSDSLRFAQNEGGFSEIELARSAVGKFEGIVDLPPGTVYAAAAVEDLGGTYLDSDFGRFWEYFETDAEGRPTLEARRYQILAALEFNVPRAAQVAEQATLEFPGQPEFWLWRSSFDLATLPAASIDTLRPIHVARLGTLDRAARNGNPGPVEMDALSRYGRLLGRGDIADYWWGQLRTRYPRHGATAEVNLQTTMRSQASIEAKLDALEEDWVSIGAPTTARLGLRFSYEFAEPRLTEEWLARLEGSSWGRDLGSDTEVARRLLEVPTLWTVAERWIRDLLSHSYDWVGFPRRLDQSRYNFDAETHHQRAHLYLYLARIRLGRGDATGGVDALERSVEEAWNPAVFVRAAEIHRSLGAHVRAAQLISLAQVDPIVPLEPYLPSAANAAPHTPADTALAAARAAMQERIVAGLLDEPVIHDVGLRTETGDETTLEQAAGPGRAVTLVLYTVRPSLIPDDVFALLERNSERLGSSGVQTVLVTQQPDSSPEEHSEIGFEFHHDPDYRAWEALGAWRSLQYFVLDRSGRLRHRGEGLEAALRISLALTM